MRPIFALLAATAIVGCASSAGYSSGTKLPDGETGTINDAGSTDATVPVDTTPQPGDSGSLDAGTSDTGPVDSGLVDTSPVDTGPVDISVPDAVVGPSPTVRISTSKGDMVVELNPAKAPNTVANFLVYVKEGFFDGSDDKGATIFHRVIKGFMIQGGGFTANMQKKATHPPIAIESNNGLSNLRGTIAMARTNNPNSATSQF